ncbi:MAG: hypothetical protein M3Y52_02660 [Actinomycetota bacterium]|nr:hypothetical protein [Actinomycetota bacterium]
MTEITDRADVARILADPRYRVPEPAAATATSFDRFRAQVSRFANGALHEGRRARLEAMLATLDLRTLADDAAARTRRMLGAEGVTLTAAWHVPVATLADALGFPGPDDAPRLVAQVAGRYATGRPSETGDAAIEESAIERLRAASGTDDDEADLRVQLLVQAYASTGALVIGAMRALAASGDPGTSTHDLLHRTLRDDAPVPTTRRVGPDGRITVLRLDGPDRDATTEHERRVLAFGDGPRRCPAPRHALAIAGAIIDELRRGPRRHPSGSSPADRPQIRGATRAHPS